MTDDRADPDRDASTATVGERWRELLVDEYGVSPEQARAVRATAFADPTLTLDAPDAEQIRASVQSALDDYDIEALLDSSGAASDLENELLMALEEGLDGHRPGPAVAPAHVRAQSTPSVTLSEPARDRVLDVAERVLTATDWATYGVDDPGAAFVDETLDRLGDRIESDADSDAQPSGTESPAGPETAPGLGPGIDAAAQRGYNFEQPDSATDSDSVDQADLPEITSASTLRDLIDSADLSTAQIEALVEYLRTQHLEEDTEE